MTGKQYKVHIEKGRRFTGSFDPESLEAALNSNAADGWHVVSSTWKSMSSEVLVILERDGQ
ncbi:MAG: DUF4177 domain-containing protein [Actinomycetota bacterium]|nr:DUF4177 domain-containing protein [Actinomycetota bacterium]